VSGRGAIPNVEHLINEGADMANIAKRSDGRWRARYRDTQGRKRARHFTRKIDAQNWLDSVTTAVTTGTYVDPRLSKITVAEWAPRWLATNQGIQRAARPRTAHPQLPPRRLRTRVKIAGLDGMTPHALRHTAASLAIAAGANVKVVQTMLGHKSATMTLDLHGHLFETSSTKWPTRWTRRELLRTLRTNGSVVDLATRKERRIPVNKGLSGRARRDSNPQPLDP
jgi:hypothetical protein